MLLCYPIVFWEQQGLQTFGQKIQITRPQASQPAFERHFAQLTEEYGFVHAVNLLGTKENEATLTQAYDRSLKNAPELFNHSVGITHFDFHHIVRIHGHEGVLPMLKFVFRISPSSLYLDLLSLLTGVKNIS